MSHGYIQSQQNDHGIATAEHFADVVVAPSSAAERPDIQSPPDSNIIPTYTHPRGLLFVSHLGPVPAVN